MMPRKLLFFTSILTLLLFSLKVYAKGFSINSLKSVSNYREGVKTRLSDAEIRELIPWASSSKIALGQLLKKIEYKKVTQQEEYLVEHIEKIVVKSERKFTELLMRYVLQRSLYIQDVLINETVASDFVMRNVRIMFLIEAVKFSLKYYESDLKFLNSSHTSSEYDQREKTFMVFAKKYSDFLENLSLSITDASALYQLEKINLGFYYVDRDRAPEHKLFAATTIEIHDFLSSLPLGDESSDAQLLGYVSDIVIFKKELNSDQFTKEH